MSGLQERDGIERVISRICTLIQCTEFHFKEVLIENKLNFDQSILKKYEKDLTIKDFISKSSHLIGLLIRTATDSLESATKSGSIPFHYISVNLLFDCSSYIPKVNKMFNIILLTTFAYALYFLGLEYAISVVSDSKFKFILKAFEEPHSVEALQRVLDCCLISRYRIKYAETFHQFIENMKDNEKEGEKDGKEGEKLEKDKKYPQQRALFLFTDGLDENLKSVEAWNRSVLTDPANSFGIIVTVPSALENQEKKLMEDLWNNFNNNTRKAISLITVESNFHKPETLYEICSCFKKVLIREATLQNDLQPKIYRTPAFDVKMEELKTNDFAFIIFDSAKAEAKKSIYVQNDKSDFPNKKLQLEKVNINLYRGKTGKIVPYTVKEEIHDLSRRKRRFDS